MKKRLLPCHLVTLLLCYFLSVSPTRAAGEFETSYDVTYEVRPDTTCAVHQRITLVNKTREFYASEHSLDLGKAKISEVWARDPEGYLTPEVAKSGENTIIKTVFSRPVAGEGKTLVWDLGYKSDASKKWGNILRIDIPGIKKESKISSYQLRLKVPKSFGKPVFISPTPRQSSEDGSFWVYEFEKEKLLRGGIRAGFGERQIFDFVLKYHLKNPSSGKAFLEVALPPDISGRQKIIFESISSAPESIQIDEDGNYLARFFLESEESKTIEFRGKAAIFYPEVSSFGEGKGEDLPRDLVECYTGGDKFWEIENGEIKERAQALTRPQSSVFENAYSIYEYVVAHLSYDEERMGKDFERFGAAKALKERNNALCTEYADLFVTLARAAGIPARVLEGYAYTEDSEFRPTLKDVLHSWVEVYLPGVGWWQVDPTWGSTTGGSDYFSQFDLSHFVFAIKGIDSETPYPAGTYRWDEGQEGLIAISFSESDTPEEGQVRLDLELYLPEAHLAGWPVTGKLVIRNNESQSAFDAATKFVAHGPSLKSEKEISLGTIPPWSEKEVEFTLSSPWLRDTRGRIEVGVSYSDFSGHVTGEVLSSEAHLIPFWRYLFSRWLLLPLGLMLLGVGAWIFRSGKLPLDIRWKSE